MPESISGAAITKFFRDGFEHTAWRLETRRAYGVAAESPRLRAFLAGDADHGRAPTSEWLDVIRELVRQRKRVERVRLVDEPATDYQRFLLNNAPDNIEAGENIRYLTRRDAERAELPMEDFWLFDSRVIGRFRFDGDRSLGMHLSEDPAAVLKGCQIRDVAWHFAVPYADFHTRPSTRE
ncbi:DUF6879 family protein [Embleya sp. NBC_00888]|uniref:DUF6879 family protein n=1 Tax=Embleya sp. NBC_00888 TaxID=2975960 RepID=UPI003869D1DB